MDVQSDWPRARRALIFSGLVFRVGVVERDLTIFSGREARKAPKQLIVLGTCHVLGIV